MDILTKQVAEQYENYPFPNSKENINFYREAQWFKEMLDFFSEKAPPGQSSFLQKSSILEVGCGTGPTISYIAQKFPNCTAVGLDMSVNALNQAENTRKLHQINNLKFIEDNILTMELNRKFDVILGIGVLHHLSDIRLGLRKLVSHLSPGGYIFLWLYGEYGRYYLNLNQKMLRTLLSAVPDIKKKIELTKKIINQSPLKYLLCHVDTPDQKETEFKKNLAFSLENESWLVDQFLHAHEQTLTIEKILPLLEMTNLKLIRWQGVSTDISSYINDPEVVSLFNVLPQFEQLKIIDLLIKPNFYCLVTSQ